MAMDVLVTGANRGIGLEFARQFAARGDRVLATCRRPAEAEELQALGVRVAGLDVTSAEDIAAVAGSLADSSLDLLINNAGVGVSHRELGALDYDEMERFYRINAMAPLRLAEALLPAMLRGQERKIVSLTSRMGSIRDNSSGGSYAYRASKAALNMINRSLAIDLRERGFRCVVLHPGWVQTEMGGDGANVSTLQSVAGMLQVIGRLDDEMSGGFFDYTGEQLPW